MQKFVLSWLLLWALPAWSAEISMDFRDLPFDQTPTNFQSVVAGAGKPGVWNVIMASVPPLLAPLSDRAPNVAASPVLAQLSQDATGEHFPILVYEKENFADFTLSTRFKIVSGVAEQMAGMVFRYQNASNFYVVRASALGHNVKFYKMVDGEYPEPIGPTEDVTAGVWHTLHIKCLGTQISFGIDDNPQLKVNDPTFVHGKIGFWTKSDSVTYFSDLHIDYKPITPGAQKMVANLLHVESRLLGLKIYTLDDSGQPRVIASKDPLDIGKPGDKAEKAAITDGTVSVGWGTGAVSVWLPLRDRNGDPIAAVVVRLKSFYGETQENATTRATQVVKRMQDQVTSSEDLFK